MIIIPDYYCNKCKRRHYSSKGNTYYEHLDYANTGRPKKNITKKDLAQISFSDAGTFHKNRYKKTHPDTLQTARTTFLRPNRLWKKHPDRYDVLGYDTEDAPKFSSLPKNGLKGQVVKYRGKLYVAGKNGKFKKVQKQF